MKNQDSKQTQMTEAQAIEGEVINKCHELMDAVNRTDPGWMAMYEDALPDSAEREVIVDLMKSAPNHFALGVLYGKFLMRMQIAEMTDREFA